MLSYPLSSGVPVGITHKDFGKYGVWFDGSNVNIREYSDLFGTSYLTNPIGALITNLYNGAGLTVASNFWNGTWHNYPNTSPSSIVTAFDGTNLDDSFMEWSGARSHDYYPNSTGSVRWHHLEPTKGSFVWTNLDKWVDDHETAGRDLTLTLGFCPAWATGTGSGSSHYDNGASPISSSNAPTSMTDFEDMCAAIASRYNSSELRIKYIEVWNEGNVTDDFYAGTATEMAQMYRIANQQFKAVNAGTKIVGGVMSGVASSARSWITNVLDASDGAGGTGATGSLGEKWLDLFSFHLYWNSAYLISSFITDLAAYRSLLSARGYGSTEIWCNETGVNKVHCSGPYSLRLTYLLRVIYWMATQSVDRIWLYSVDNDLLSPFRYYENVSAGANLIQTHIDYLLNRRVTNVNSLWTQQIAVTLDDGTKILI